MRELCNLSLSFSLTRTNGTCTLPVSSFHLWEKCVCMPLSMRLKEYFTSKKEILWLFTYPHVVPNLYHWEFWRMYNPNPITMNWEASKRMQMHHKDIITVVHMSLLKSHCSAAWATDSNLGHRLQKSWYQTKLSLEHSWEWMNHSFESYHFNKSVRWINLMQMFTALRINKATVWLYKF